MHILAFYGTEAEADAIYPFSTTADLLRSEFLNRYDDLPSHLSHPTPIATHCQRQSMPLVCICFFFFSFSSAFPPIFPRFPRLFSFIQEQQATTSTRRQAQTWKSQHTLKRLTNGDNVKHERSEWSVQSGESWGKARGKQGAFVVGSPPGTSHHSPSNSGGSPARLKDAGQVGGHKMVGSAAGFR